MNVYDEDKSFRLFNKYCNNNFVCVVSKWGKKTHQEINREYKGKYLEDIYAVNGREMSKISLKYKDENGKLMIARNNNLNILSRSEMLENVLSYIEKYYNIVCKDNFDYFLKQIRDNWCCIVSNDEYCIEIFETKSAVRDADIAGSSTNGEKVLCSSSRANIIPAKGELKAAAKPADAPAVIKNSSFARSLFMNLFANPSPIEAPI